MHTPNDQQHAWCELSEENCCEIVIVVVVGAGWRHFFLVVVVACMYMYVCVNILLRAARLA